ncbi:MAG: hypothetical protein H6825_05895 [Planctomycetes bacterium]|nr:hypothetical protein [Planctomycetota bacterium]
MHVDHGLAMKVLEANPGASDHARTAVVSSFLAFQRAQAAGEPQLAVQSLANGHAILRRFVDAGYELDPEMGGLLAWIESTFGGGASR